MNCFIIYIGIGLVTSAIVTIFAVKKFYLSYKNATKTRIFIDSLVITLYWPGMILIFPVIAFKSREPTN